MENFGLWNDRVFKMGNILCDSKGFVLRKGAWSCHSWQQMEWQPIAIWRSVLLFSMFLSSARSFSPLDIIFDIELVHAWNIIFRYAPNQLWSCVKILFEDYCNRKDLSQPLAHDIRAGLQWNKFKEAWGSECLNGLARQFSLSCCPYLHCCCTG